MTGLSLETGALVCGAACGAEVAGGATACAGIFCAGASSDAADGGSKVAPHIPQKRFVV
jgi:hypothetical protein